MTKKTRITLANLGQVPVTPVVNKTGFETKKEFIERLQREEEAPIKKQIALQEATFRKLRKLSSEFWSRDLESIVPEIYSDSSKSMTLNVPATRAEYERADMEQAADTWYYTIFKPLGFDLNPQGATRLRAFIDASAFHGFDMSQPSNIHAAWLHLKDDLHAFADGEVLGMPLVPQAETPAEPQPTLDNIENYALESTSGRKQALKIVEELASAEAAVICGQWLSQIKRDYDFVPSRQQITEVVRWFNFNAKNWLRHRSYDECRRALVSQKLFPRHMLSNDEIVCQEIERETTPLMAMGFDDRVALKTKIRRLADPA